MRIIPAIILIAFVVLLAYIAMANRGSNLPASVLVLSYIDNLNINKITKAALLEPFGGIPSIVFLIGATVVLAIALKPYKNPYLVYLRYAVYFALMMEILMLVYCFT